MQPFRVDFPQEDLDDLARRLDGTRWPRWGFEQGWDTGVPSPYLEGLVRYWREGFDWRAVEARLNRLPQFTTEIDGVGVHFLHVRSPSPDAVPLLLTHGWPGSVLEFLDVVGPLTDPAAHGADPGDAFHLVIPSLPGFGFSDAPREPGWGTRRIALAWAELMRRLGYERYIAQGGDAGAVVSLELGRHDPDHVAGTHVNMLMTFPRGEPGELEGLSEPEIERLARLTHFERHLSGYMKLQSTRPRTLAYALNDSPVGQLAWIAEKFVEWTDRDGAPEGSVDRDTILAHATLYWLTGTSGSSAQLYFEDADGLAGGADQGPPLTVPLGVAVFPHDIFVPLRRLAERDFPTLRHWTEFPAGGHFAALERPADLVADIRNFARGLR